MCSYVQFRECEHEQIALYRGFPRLVVTIEEREKWLCKILYMCVYSFSADSIDIVKMQTTIFLDEEFSQVKFYTGNAS